MEGAEAFPEASSSNHPAGNPLTLEYLVIVLFPVLLPGFPFNESQLPTCFTIFLFCITCILGTKRGIMAFPTCPTAPFVSL